MTGNARFTLAAVMLVTLVSTAGIALPYPILAPLFLDTGPGGLTRFLGIPPKLLLGIALAVYPLGVLLGGSVIGALSDRYGRRRVLLATLAGGLIGYLISGLAIALESYALFIAARLVAGVFEGNLSIARAIAADLHPAIERTRALSLVYAAVYGGWFIGPLAGGYLMPLGAETAFYAAGGALAVAMILTRLAVAETAPLGIRPGSIWQAVWRENSLALLALPRVRSLFWIHLVYMLGINAFYEFYPVWLVEVFGFDSRGIALWTVVLTLAMILTSALAVSWIGRLLEPTRAMLASILATAGALAILPWSEPARSLLLFLALGALIAIYNGLFPAYAAEHYGSRYGQGRLMGLLTTTFFFANVLIAIAGSLVALAGAGWTLLLGAVLVGAAARLFARERHSTPAAQAAVSPEELGQ